MPQVIPSLGIEPLRIVLLEKTGKAAYRAKGVAKIMGDGIGE